MVHVVEQLDVPADLLADGGEELRHPAQVRTLSNVSSTGRSIAAGS